MHFGFCSTYDDGGGDVNAVVNALVTAVVDAVSNGNESDLPALSWPRAANPPEPARMNPQAQVPAGTFTRVGLDATGIVDGQQEERARKRKNGERSKDKKKRKIRTCALCVAGLAKDDQAVVNPAKCPGRINRAKCHHFNTNGLPK